MVELEPHQAAIGDFLGHEERRLVDDALAGDGGKHEGVAVVGPEVARDGDLRLAVPSERPAVGAQRLRQGVAEAVVFGGVRFFQIAEDSLDPVEVWMATSLG
jgi:hypothetical protein